MQVAQSGTYSLVVQSHGQHELGQVNYTLEVAVTPPEQSVQRASGHLAGGHPTSFPALTLNRPPPGDETNLMHERITYHWIKLERTPLAGEHAFLRWTMSGAEGGGGMTLRAYDEYTYNGRVYYQELARCCEAVEGGVRCGVPERADWLVAEGTFGVDFDYELDVRG